LNGRRAITLRPRLRRPAHGASKEEFALHAAPGKRSAIVDFLCLGVQKAGTTWLHKVLEEHPQVFVARGEEDKDTRFFSHFYDYGYEWYERHFEPGRSAARRGEVSTSYFYSKDAPERVHRYRPDMRLLLCLRNPLDRLISNHRHEIRIGHVTGENRLLENGLANNPSYVEQSLYATQLAHWLEVFPLSSFHVLIFEEVFAAPEAAIRGVYEFLGVDPAFRPPSLHEKVNEGRIPRSRLADRAFRLAARGLRRIGLGSLVDSVKRAGAKDLNRASETRSGSYMTLDPKTRRELQELFAQETRRLEEMLGRDLSVWRH